MRSKKASPFERPHRYRRYENHRSGRATTPQSSVGTGESELREIKVSAPQEYSLHGKGGRDWRQAAVHLYCIEAEARRVNSCARTVSFRAGYCAAPG
jgi:hypothetical protein